MLYTNLTFIIIFISVCVSVLMFPSHRNVCKRDMRALNQIIKIPSGILKSK